MTNEENEILDFYRTGASISQLAEVYGITQYRLKKFLANEPAIQPLGYIWRSLYPSKVIAIKPQSAPLRILANTTDGIHPDYVKQYSNKNLNLNV